MTGLRALALAGRVMTKKAGPRRIAELFGDDSLAP